MAKRNNVGDLSVGDRVFHKGTVCAIVRFPSRRLAVVQFDDGKKEEVSTLGITKEPFKAKGVANVS